MTTANELQGYPWEETKPKKSKKPVLIVAGALALLSVGVIAILAFMLTDSSPSPTTLAKCDTWMRQQLVAVPDAAANAVNANTVVAYVQSQRPDSCPPSTWNPLVTNVTRETSGNIEVNFSTVTGQARGTAVTMAANGATSWAYSADQNTWDSRQWTPDQARPTYTPQPLTAATVPAAQGTPPVQYATDPQRTGMQPNATTPDPDHLKEIGDYYWFSDLSQAERDRANELLHRGDYHGAIQAYQSAQIQHGKPSSILESLIGTAYKFLGNHQLAIDHFTKAIEIEDNPVDRTNRAQSYIGTGQCPLAIHDAKQALDMKPESTDGLHSYVEAHVVLGNCSLASGDNAQAIKHAKAALPLMKKNNYSAKLFTAIHFGVGNAYYREEQYAQAIEHYSQAIALGDTASARAGRAWAYIATKDCTSALTDGHKALAMPAASWSEYHSWAEAHGALSYCYADESQWEKALQHEESSLRLMYENQYEAATIAVAEENVQFLRTQAAQ